MNSAPSSPLPWAPRTDLRSHSSMAQRSDFLELDCQLTRDGVVVVSHDENLSRQSGVNRDVSSLDFEVGLALAPHRTQRATVLPRGPSGDLPPVLPRSCPSTRRSWRFTSHQVGA